MIKMKKLLACVLTAAMTLSMGMTSFAANGATNKHTITIKPAPKQMETHTYEAYQVFAGDVDTKGVLSNVTWASGVNGTAIQNAVKADTSTFGADATKVTSAADVAELLAKLANDSDGAKKFASIVGKNLATKAGESAYDTTNKVYTIQVTGDGYYFIKDKNANIPIDGDEKADHVGDTATRYILQVVKDVEVTAKAGTVESNKKVDDINDTEGIKPVDLKNDSADYDIGDKVPYMLSFTLPDNYADYKDYYVAFVDDMSKGLSFNQDAKIYYGVDPKENASAAGTTVTFTKSGTSDYSGGAVWRYEIPDLKKVTAASRLTGGSKIYITYTATLTEDCIIGEDGNPNKFHAEYDRDPNEDGKGTPGETPDDENIVFTYTVEVNKITGESTPLAGANFALYKLYAEVPSGKTRVTSIKYDNGTKDYAIAANENWVLVEEKTAAADTQFDFKGVDDGTYLLVETKTPAGYNSIEPSRFKVEATHNNGDTPSFGEVKGTDISGPAVNLGTNTLVESGKVTGLKTSILNKEGAVLPATGGVGTTLFYIIGSVLVVGAGVVLVARRRMQL